MNDNDDTDVRSLPVWECRQCYWWVSGLDDEGVPVDPPVKCPGCKTNVRFARSEGIFTGHKNAVISLALQGVRFHEHELTLQWARSGLPLWAMREDPEEVKDEEELE